MVVLGKNLKKIYDRDPNLGKFWLESAKNIKDLNEKFEFSWNDIKELRPEMRKFWLKAPVLVNMYNDNGFCVPDLVGIYKKDEKLFDAIIENSSIILSTLQYKKLTFEDLKKCTVNDIKDLAYHKISTEQLKKELITRSSSNLIVGKWTEQIQQKSQSTETLKTIQK